MSSFDNSANTSTESMTKKEDANELLKDSINLEIPLELFQYLSSNDYDIQNVCRICLSPSNKDMYSLETTKDKCLLSEMFTYLTSIQISTEDNLPISVCSLCQNEIIHCYEFKVKCTKSDCTLKTVLTSDLATNDDSNLIVKDCQARSSNCSTDLRNEAFEHKDVEYLELSDSETLYVTQKTIRNKKAQKSYFDNISPKNERQKNIACDHCSKKFVKMWAFNSHMRKCHGISVEPYSCEICKQSFSCAHDLAVHSSLHSKGAKWKCNQCEKEYSSRTVLRRHLQRHMQRKPHACECGKTFVELCALRRHRRVHDAAPRDRDHVCHRCGKGYADGGTLSAHMRTHSDQKPYVCSVCGNRFTTPRLLASHLLVHSERKPYACDYCDKRFRHESTRNTHHRTHTGDRPYVCALCGKAFIQASNLRLHTRTHTGERPYSCRTCSRLFSSGSALKAHERIHTGERPYACEICGKRFARHVLRTHMRVHGAGPAAARNHACSACGRAFHTAARLRDHARLHTGEKPYECETCSKRFQTRSHLIKHIKSHTSTKCSKKPKQREMLIVHQIGNEPYILAEKIMFANKQNVLNIENNEVKDNDNSKNNLVFNLDQSPAVEIAHEVPMEVSEELVLHEDSNKTNLLVVDNSQVNVEYGDGTVCVANGVNFVNNDVNLVTVNEGGMSIASSSAMVEGATVKLYQLDQSLVQIHSAGGQVTISKITSKMTANF